MVGAAGHRDRPQVLHAPPDQPFRLNARTHEGMLCPACARSGHHRGAHRTKIAEQTDWQIVALHERFYLLHPSPALALARNEIEKGLLERRITELSSASELQ